MGERGGERIACVALTVRFDVEGPHLTDGLALSPMIGAQAFGLPRPDSRFASSQTTSRTEFMGGFYVVRAMAVETVAMWPKHDGWVPEWTSPDSPEAPCG